MNLSSRFLVLLVLIFLFTSRVFAQGGCMLIPVDNSRKAASSSLIAEGEVTSVKCYQSEDKTKIYTVNTLNIFRVFKGSASQRQIRIVTEGGQVGMNRMIVSAENSFEVGDHGLFFLMPARYGFEQDASLKPFTFEIYAAEQGFLRYEEQENRAIAPFTEIRNLPLGIDQLMRTLGYPNPVVIAPPPVYNSGGGIKNGQNPAPLTVPTITSFTPTTISSGTNSILTINGSGFGATKGTGYVEFRNANNPSSVVWVQPKAKDYISWSDTQIQLRVPSSSNGAGPGAGTGQIRVTNSTASPNQATSTGTLTINFAEINVEFNASGLPTDLYNDNTTGGYTFQFCSTDFPANGAAMNSFLRAFYSWKCETDINWSIGATTTIDVAANDGTNTIRFDTGAELPAGVAGRATSNLSGCLSAADTVWYPVDQDITFDDGLVFQYGPALPSASEIDFETVALHELGHWHMLDHVINTSAVMHAEVSYGLSKRVLQAAETAGGAFMAAKAFSLNNGICVTPFTAMTALDVHATVSIAASPGTSICSGTSVTFTATTTFPTGTIAYQWKKNGVNVGTNSATYTDAGLANGNTITCTITQTGGCNDVVTSNTITMTVTSPVAPSVTISANPGNSICAGTSVTFTAVPVNGGASPSYQWKVNGTNAGTNSSTFTTTTLTNGQIVTCVMTSNASCITTSTATSNAITMAVTSAVSPSISISSSLGNSICAGNSVTFSSLILNGGATPSYQWKVNGVNVGTNSSTYTTTTLTNGQIVTCVLTSNAACASPASVTSNAITMTVSPIVAPAVSISANTGNTICAGTSVTFTAVPTNGGTTPSYQWKVNGTNVGTNSATYTTTGLTNGQVVTCVMTHNNLCSSPATATSNAITMTVNPVVVPSVTISANPGNTICGGTSVTFTATATNGGPGVIYNWKLNGINVGTNSATYTNAALVNGDFVTCAITSNATCASPTGAGSNTITMTVTTPIIPSVSIVANPGNTICAGTSVTFTATPANGGITPSYQWKVNGLNTGTNSTTFTSTTLANSNVVTCVMTSSASCVSPATVTSNSITMTVNPVVTPTISIAASPGSTICSGTSVTFTASITNGGSTPVYQWKKNANAVGTNSATYSDNALVNGDQVSCVVTSNATCASPTTENSNTITMTVNPVLTPSVSISASTGTTICAGTSVTFTATPANGGATPAYQWKLNGTNVGTNSATYTNASLTNGQIVTCVLTSNATCASPTTATSNALTMTVNPVLVPAVSISASTGTTICAGTSVTFTATPTNGGTTPAYQWKLNGTNVGTNSATYTNAALTNGQIVTCVLTSNATCASPTTATSNALTMTVNPVLVPAVSINASTGTTICAGTSVTFTATPTNGGTTPAYQWKVNGTNAGTNSVTFTTTTLTNGQIVTCVLTSNATCASPVTATSNAITMNVLAGIPIVTSVTPSNGPVGTSIVVKGSRFTGTTQVQIGSGSTTTFTLSGDTMITMLVPAGATTGIVKLTNLCGTNSAGPTFTVGTASVILNLSLNIEGFYLGSNTLAPVRFTNGLTTNSSACDSITIQLRNTTAPYATVQTINGLLLTNGTCQVTFPGSVIGNSYYIVVKHRNSIETWSKLPVLFSSTTNFTFKQ
ncbi:MAG: IPT/TIG domain-containing protein [Bacteroidia bacterium]